MFIRDASGIARLVYVSELDFVITAGVSGIPGDTTVGYGTLSGGQNFPGSVAPFPATLSDGHVFSRLSTNPQGGNIILQLAIRGFSSPPSPNYLASLTVLGLTLTPATASSTLFPFAFTDDMNWFWTVPTAFVNTQQYPGIIKLS